MKRLPAIFLTLAMALAAHTADAAAQSLDSPYRFLDHNQFAGAFAGYMQPSDGRIGGGPAAAPVFGASWGIGVSGPFTFTVELAGSATSRIVRDTVFVAADSTFAELGEADMTLLIGMANMRFNITGARTWNGLQPFMMLGAGLVRDMSGDAAIEAELPENTRFDYGTSFAGQLGAGVDWFSSSRLSVRLDARNVLWKLGVPDAFGLTESGRTLPRSQWEQNLVATAGLFFNF
ncbi:hypothetical protein BH23GEM10_BH23GEM10_07780 [soil metagenome]